MQKALSLILCLIVTLPGCFKRSIRMTKTAIADTSVIPTGFDCQSSFALMADDPDDLQTSVFLF